MTKNAEIFQIVIAFHLFFFFLRPMYSVHLPTHWWNDFFGDLTVAFLTHPRYQSLSDGWSPNFHVYHIGWCFLSSSLQRSPLTSCSFTRQLFGSFPLPWALWQKLHDYIFKSSVGFSLAVLQFQTLHFHFCSGDRKGGPVSWHHLLKRLFFSNVCCFKKLS